jgi:thiaminase
MPPAHPNQPLHPQHTPLSKLLLDYAPVAFQSATQHPFLRQAGLGQVSTQTLSRWLSQDRIYAQAYVNFIGALIARIHLPHTHIRDKGASLRWRILKLLTDCLNNINRELDLFDETSRKYNLPLDQSQKPGVPFEPASATKQYEGLFRAFGSDPSMSLLEGLVVLWATETCYLHAWKYARSFWPEERSTNPDRAAPMPGIVSPVDPVEPLQWRRVSELPGQEPEPYRGPAGQSPEDPRFNIEPPTPQSAVSATTIKSGGSSHYSNDPAHAGPLTPVSEREVSDAPELVIQPRKDLDGGALQEAFIPNWTSREFEVFVEEIADVMDELSIREEGWRRVEVFKAVWEHILGIEAGFWPDV